VSRLTLLPVVAALAMCGCVTTNTTMLVPPQKYAPVPADSVRVFLSEQEIKDKGYDFERVALIYATGSAEYTSESGMVKKLRHDAGQRGANGIVLSPINEPGAGAKVVGALFGVGTQRKGEVVAVRWWVRTDSTATSH
jgi:hypothetical protein